jgi:hypothetical protein
LAECEGEGEDKGEEEVEIFWIVGTAVGEAMFNMSDIYTKSTQN